MVVTDPPYNVALGWHMRPSEAKQLHRRTDGLVIDNDDMDEDSFVEFLTAAFENMMAALRDGGAWYIWHADVTRGSFLKACERSGMEVREVLVWAKNQFSLGRQDYQWQHEPCLYGWKDGAPHWFAPTRRESTVLQYDKPSASELHPTMKPIKLIARLIENSSKRGDVVLDPFGGSGTTLMACEKLDRTCWTMELDPHYCDVILQRWENLTGKEAVRVD